MKTTSHIYPTHRLHLIDTAPLVARYELLCAAMIMLVDAGQVGRVFGVSQKVRRLIRTCARLDKHNVSFWVGIHAPVTLMLC